MNEELDHDNDSYSVATGDHDNDSYSVPTGDHDNDSYSVPTGDHDDDSYSVKTTAKKESTEKEPGPVAAVKTKTTQASCRSSYRWRRCSFDTFRQSFSSPLSTPIAGRLQTRRGGEQIGAQSDSAGAR